MSEQLTTFSVLLGLTDYVNPIFYTLFFLTMLKNLKDISDPGMFKIFKFGAIVSLVGGYIIPTGKVIVGLGLLDFVMPVPVVHFVNTGFLISGVTLFLIVRNKTFKELPILEDVLLIALYVAAFAAICVFSKYNTAAVLTGVVGIVLIYISIIMMSTKKKRWVSTALAVLSFALTLFLAVVGVNSDLYSAAVHWLIELTNIVCQCSLFMSAKLLFKTSNPSWDQKPDDGYAE